MLIYTTRFYANVRMSDLTPSHFHVKYGEYKAIFSIDELKIIKGDLPKRVILLVLEWAFIHREELQQDWELAVNYKPLNKIEPLC